MRHILVNYAQSQRAAKRPGAAPHLCLDNLELPGDDSVEELLTLDALLKQLDANHPRRSRVVECRVFGGMSVEETAAALDVSTATVKREWRIASAWLYRAINAGEGSPQHGIDSV